MAHSTAVDPPFCSRPPLRAECWSPGVFDSPPLADEGPACSDAAWASGQGYTRWRGLRSARSRWRVVAMVRMVSGRKGGSSREWNGVQELLLWEEEHAKRSPKRVAKIINKLALT